MLYQASITNRKKQNIARNSKKLNKVIIIPDNVKIIIKTVRDFHKRYTYVFTIGGILLMVTNYVAVSTILILIGVPLFLYFSCDFLSFNFILSISVLSIIIFIKHIENLSKIFKGTENTFWSVFKK